MILQGPHPGGLTRLRGERRLFAALAASVALHLALLASGVRVPVSRPAALPLRAELHTLPMPAPTPAAVAVAKETARPQPSRARPRMDPPAAQIPPRRPAAAPSPQPRAAAEPALPLAQDATVPPGAATASSRAPDPVEVPGSRRGNAPPLPERALAVLAAPEGEPGGIDPDALREYRFALARAVIRHYPSAAREQGLSGTAEIRLTMAADGRSREVALRRSSGHRVLDAEARAMISGAAARAALPERLRGQEFAVDLPVRFELRDAED